MTTLLTNELDQPAQPAKRGYCVTYQPGEPLRCPGCGSRSWHVGRRMAECARCETAVPLAEAA